MDDDTKQKLRKIFLLKDDDKQEYIKNDSEYESIKMTDRFKERNKKRELNEFI